MWTLSLSVFVISLSSQTNSFSIVNRFASRVCLLRFEIVGISIPTCPSPVVRLPVTRFHPSSVWPAASTFSNTLILLAYTIIDLKNTSLTVDYNTWCLSSAPFHLLKTKIAGGEWWTIVRATLNLLESVQEAVVRALTTSSKDVKRFPQTLTHFSPDSSLLQTNLA